MEFHESIDEFKEEQKIWKDYYVTVCFDLWREVGVSQQH